jgi:hypothetical protein
MGVSGSLGRQGPVGWRSNLQRITESPDERILLIIGGGHIPVLRHCVQASPEYALVELEAFLR